VEPFLVAFLTCLILTPSVIRFASRRQWFDIPDERKIHNVQIPRLGGTAIISSLLISILLSSGADTLLELRYFLAGLLILFFVGLWDDMQPVSPLVKLLGESVPVILITFFNRIPLHSMFPQYEWIQALEWPVTLFLSFWIVNAFNLIDGINGLAGTIGILALTGMGILGNPVVYQLSYAFAGALLAFLFFNFVKPRIFMGDCGSLPLGYTLAFGMSHLCYQETSGLPADEPFLVIALMIVPLFDMLRVFVIRLYYGKNPFRGDRNHLHHLLLESGLSHVSATSLIALLSIITTGLVWMVFHSGIPASMMYSALVPALILPSLIFSGLLWLKVRRIRKNNPSL
jgi:UDP-N-acetylmuramyl pentapeptide phosphotransferase/UDP-N-acetylglucosamine-1-phosphate transferase